MPFRLQKIESLLKDELSVICLAKLQGDDFGLITVTNVKVSPDLRIAKVYISVFNKDNRKRALEKVNEINGVIRWELASKVTMRYVPELKFFIDDTMDYVEKINNLIKKIHEDDNKKDE